MHDESNTSTTYKQRESRLRIERREAELTAMPSGRKLQCLLVDVSAHGLGLVTLDNILPDTQIVLKVGAHKIYLELAWCQLSERNATGYRYGFKVLDRRINLAELMIARGYVNLRVLIVDDDTDIAELFSSCLARAGFDVRVASGGNEAAGIMDQGRFHAVLSDMTMPDGDGLVVIREAQAQSIPVAVMTGMLEQCESVPHNVPIFEKASLRLEEMSSLVATVVSRR